MSVMLIRSSNVTLYGAESEGHFVVVWIRDSDLIKIHGYGGDGAPCPNSYRYPAGRCQFVPSQFRVQWGTRVRLANLVDRGRITDNDGHLCTLVAAGSGTDPRKCNLMLHQN